MTAPADEQELRRDLGAGDFTLLVVGAIIGADVYVVSGFGAQLLGPAQLVAWAVAGVLAALIGLAFVQCGAVCPEVGGSYAYAHEAFGPLVGFIAGWALYLGEWIALPVFPLAFVSYLGQYFPAATSGATAVAVKAVLVLAVTGVNLVGVRKGGRLNDILTVAKLVPLVVLVVAALAYVLVRHSDASSHLVPFVPLGWSGFGAAVVLIFWAYAGFELAVLPAAEVSDPQRTLPRGLFVGMAIATAFYVLTALAVVVALPWHDAATTPRPLADALHASVTAVGLPSGWAAGFMSLGALVSIAGVFDVFTLCVARLAYAMAKDGLFPPPFVRVSTKYGAPWFGLLFQGATAFVLSLLLNLASVISIAVFFLGICYVTTALAALRFVHRQPEQRLRVPGLRIWLCLAALSGAYLATQVSHRLLLAGVLALCAGVAVYLVRREHWAAVRAEFESGEREAAQWVQRHGHWLFVFLRR